MATAATMPPSTPAPVRPVGRAAQALLTEDEDAVVVGAAVGEGVPEVVPGELPPALPVAVAAQLTAVGTVTPWAAQICEAKTTAELWSAALQPPGLARQQAMSLMKLLLEQMHLGSEPQPAMPLPATNWVTQSCCVGRRGC